MSLMSFEGVQVQGAVQIMEKIKACYSYLFVCWCFFIFYN